MEEYLIATNVDGCLIGDYYSEIITDVNKATILLQKIKQADPNARLVKVVKERKENA